MWSDTSMGTDDGRRVHEVRHIYATGDGDGRGTGDGHQDHDVRHIYATGDGGRVETYRQGVHALRPSSTMLWPARKQKPSCKRRGRRQTQHRAFDVLLYSLSLFVFVFGCV